MLGANAGAAPILYTGTIINITTKHMNVRIVYSFTLGTTELTDFTSPEKSRHSNLLVVHIQSYAIKKSS
jgi:hypothetical protein